MASASPARYALMRESAAKASSLVVNAGTANASCSDRGQHERRNGHSLSLTSEGQSDWVGSVTGHISTKAAAPLRLAW